MIFEAGMKAQIAEFQRLREAYKQRLKIANLEPLPDENYDHGHHYKPKTRQAWLLHRLLLHTEGVQNDYEFENINRELDELQKTELLDLLKNRSTPDWFAETGLDEPEKIYKSDLNAKFNELAILFVLKSLKLEDTEHYNNLYLQYRRRKNGTTKSLYEMYLGTPMK
jgi:hypothetical protein